jgi:hypothetical protein
VTGPDRDPALALCNGTHELALPGQKLDPQDLLSEGYRVMSIAVDERHVAFPHLSSLLRRRRLTPRCFT